MTAMTGTRIIECLRVNRNRSPSRPIRPVAREYSVAWLYTFVLDVLAEPISDPPRDEHDLSLFPALWIPQDKLLIDNIFRGEFQDLSDSHSSSGHKFQNKPVS